MLLFSAAHPPRNGKQPKHISRALAQSEQSARNQNDSMKELFS